MFGQLTGLGDVAFANYGDWTDRDRERRAAVCQAAAATGRRAQHRRHAARLDEREAVPARSDLQRSALPHRQRQRAADRLARVQLGHAADSRSSEERGDDVRRAGARSRACRSASAPDMPRRSTRCSRRRTGAASASGKRASTTTTRCSGATAGCGWRRRCAAPRTRRSARRARIIRRPRRSRWTAPSATSPCSIRRRKSTRSWIPASRRITRSSATTRTTRCGRAAAVRSWAG